MASGQVLAFGAGVKPNRLVAPTKATSAESNASAVNLTGASWDAAGGLTFSVSGSGQATVGFSSLVPESYKGPGALFLYAVEVKDQEGNIILNESFNSWSVDTAFTFANGESEDLDAGSGSYSGDLNWSAWSNNDPSKDHPNDDGIYGGLGAAFSQKVDPDL